MNYNTETINDVAKKLAEMFKTAVIAEQQNSHGAPKITKIEASMRESLRQIRILGLGLFLNSMQKTPASEIGCGCGGTLHDQRMREATVISVFRKTTYERAYYAGCSCKKGKAAVDEQFGLESGWVKAGLAAFLALAGIEFPYDRARNGYRPKGCLTFQRTQCVRRQSKWERCKKS